MAYKISDDCIACGTCAGVCPVSAISEGDGSMSSTRTPAWIAAPAPANARFPLFPRVDFPGKAEQSKKEAGTVVPALLFPYSGDFGLCIREGPEFLI